MRGLRSTVRGAGFLLLLAGCAQPGPRLIAPIAVHEAVPVSEPMVPDDPERGWTMEQVVRMAQARDPALAVARAEIAAALARQRDASRPEDPQLRGGAARNRRSGTRSQLPYTDRYAEYDLALRLFPANPWERRAETRRLTAELEAARGMLHLAEEQVGLAVREDVLLLQEAEADLARLDRLLALRARRFSLLQEQSAHGRVTRAEVVQAAGVQLEMMQAREARERERDRLRRRLASRIGLAHVSVPLPPDDAVEAQGEALLERAAALRLDRAEIEVLTWQVQAADAGVDAQRALRRPWVSHVQAGFGVDDRAGRNDDWSIQAGVTLPWFSRNDQRAAAASAERDAVEARLREARERAVQEIEEASVTLREALAGLQRARESSAPVLRDVQAALEPLQDGEAPDPMTALRLEETGVEIERVLMNARFEVEQARHALEAALGTPVVTRRGVNTRRGR